MRAIITHYIAPTNLKPSRIKASCARGKIIVSYDHEFDQEVAHVRAASALVARFVTEDFTKYGTTHDKNPWNRPRVVGQLPSGDFAHVFVK